MIGLENFSIRVEVGAAVCLLHRGEVVVDLGRTGRRRNRLDLRLHGIAKSDIDYDGDARAGERSRTAQADAPIF
jgi:hypothetical protein